MKEENNLLRKVSKTVVSHYKVDHSIYQQWIETYLEKAENHKRLTEFREELKKHTLQKRAEPKTELTKEICFKYTKKMLDKIDGPKAELLIRQARNMKEKTQPVTIFAHQAQQEMTFVQLKARDELYIEMDGVEYEVYLKKVEQLKLEETEEYKEIVEASKANMRAIIKKHHCPEQAA